MLGRIKRKLLSLFGPQKEGPITISPEGRLVGRVLYSYLEYCVPWDEDDPRLRGHSNKWESREIAQIFRRLGFAVEAISWEDQKFLPQKNYEIFFDIHTNLARLAPLLSSNTIKLMHLTGSYAPYQNQAEQKRVADLEKRRGVRLSPHRLIKDTNLYERSLEIADFCSLIGNEHTLKTFPPRYRSKITLVTVSTSQPIFLKTFSELVPKEREFLWFFGGGAVHKGLDLVLETFSRLPNLKLNVVGPVDEEKGFFNAYRRELTQLPNIHYYGYLDPSGEDFKGIARRCFCFIAPSCSESISTAVATCLQIGLFPIVSVDTGVTLPKGCGFYLGESSVEKVKQLSEAAYRMSEGALGRQISLVQKYALKQFSRKKFSEGMSAYLERFLGKESKV